MEYRDQRHALHRVREAITAVAAGRPVVVVDDAGRDEGDLIFAAERATPALVAFTVRHTSGFVCVALPAAGCDRLALSPMTHHNGDLLGTAYRVTVDARSVGTGISAADRARTIAALARPESVAGDVIRPGHVVPVMARAGGVLDRPGHPEAAVDLARLAGLTPADALGEIVSQEQPGEMARGAELARFAAGHDLVRLSIADLNACRRRTEQQVRRAATTTLPTEHGPFQAIGYSSAQDGAQHLALVSGTVSGRADVPVHIHTESVSHRGRVPVHRMQVPTATGRGVVGFRRSGERCGRLSSATRAAPRVRFVRQRRADRERRRRRMDSP